MDKKEKIRTSKFSLSAEAKKRLKDTPLHLKNSFRNPNVWGFFVSMAVLVIVSLAFFSPDNFDGRSLNQADMLQGMANGHEAQAYEEATGEKALWTNSLFSGMPTFQISPEYPSNSLFSWITSVYGLGLPAPSNLMFMMMFGFLIMLTCLRLRWWYALIGALAWGLSSYFIIIIGAGHIWKFVALAYVPPTIGALIMIFRGRRAAGAAILALFLMMELNANHPQITYYFAFLMFFLIIGFFIKSLMKKNIKQWCVSLSVFIGACVLAVGANLPSLYNTYEYSKETKRAASELTPLHAENELNGERPTGGLPKAEIGGWSNLPEESLSLLIPNIKGGASVKPGNGGLTGAALSDSEVFDRTMYDTQPDYATPDNEYGKIPVYDILPEYFGGKGRTNGPFYVGVLIVSLFLLGCFIVRGPIKWVLLIATVFSILLAMGNHFEALTDFMIYNVPLYNKFRAAETALVIACLCMPLLGMLALQKLFTTPNPLKNRNIVRGLSVAFIFPMFICILAYVSPSMFGGALTDTDSADIQRILAQLDQLGYRYDVDQINAVLETNVQSLRYSIVSADALRSLIFLVLGGSALLLMFIPRFPKYVAVGLFGFLVVVDLYSVDKRYVNTNSFSTSFTSATSIKPDDADRQILTDKTYYRVADIEGFGDARRSYFHNMIGGYHAAKLNRYNDLLERRIYPSLGGMYEDIYNNTVYGLPVVPQNWNVANMLNTKYVIIPAENGLHYVYTNPHAMGPAWLVNNIKYVENADEEMAALETLDPATTAVADKRFRTLLGDQIAAPSQGDYINLEKYTPNQLTYSVDTRNGGLAVFSEVWFPWGWHATIDGKEVQLGRVNYVLRAINVPSGKHTVVMTFNPRSIHVTSSIAYASVTLIYLLCAFAIFMAMISIRKPEEQ